MRSTRPRYDITTVDELIDELGGSARVAERCGISLAAVSNWRARRSIAGQSRMPLAAEIKRRGKTIAPEVFDLTEDQARSLFLDVSCSR